MDLLSAEARRNPFPIYDALRARAPVLHDPASDLWMLLDYESVHRALHEPETFSSRAAVRGGRPLDWLIFFDPPRHAKLRALVLRAFTPRVVAGLEPRIRELAATLLDAVIERGEMDVAADFSVPLPLMVIAEMLGIPIADRPQFRRWSEVILDLAESVAGSADAPRAASGYAAATVEMRAYVSALVAERRAAPRDDLLGRLVAAEVDGEALTEDDILGFFQLLLVAGSETTTNLIANTVVCLVDHPAERARLAATPSLLPSALEEVLRFRTPVQAVFRQTTRDVALQRLTIPAGKLVLAVVGAANRDPRRFPEPGRFDIGRDPNPHVAFGHGIHFCLGAALARLEARIALAEFFARIREFGPATDAPWEPRKAFHVHGPARFPIRFEPSRS
jgi:cytochrome P450